VNIGIRDPYSWGGLPEDSHQSNSLNAPTDLIDFDADLSRREALANAPVSRRFLPGEMLALAYPRSFKMPDYVRDEAGLLI